MIQVVTNCLHDFFLLFKYFFDVFFVNDSKLSGYLVPLLLIGTAIGIIIIAIKIIKKIVWGS